MFAGLMSRWTMPLACADSSASAICTPMSTSAAGAKGCCADALRERLSLEQFHRDEVPAFVLADRVDRADVRVIQRRGRARLALKPLERDGIGARRVGQELQRDAAAELRVFGFVDDAHTAGAEGFDDLVVRDSRAEHGGGRLYRS